jgi:hypothetical protein
MTQTGTDTFHYQIPFKLSDRTQNGKDHLSHRRARVDRFRKRNELDPERVECFESAEQMRNRASESIETPHDDYIESPFVGVLHHSV